MDWLAAHWWQVGGLFVGYLLVSKWIDREQDKRLKASQALVEIERERLLSMQRIEERLDEIHPRAEG